MSDKITIQELVKLLECPVCLQCLESEDCLLLQCENGHIGCQACFSRLQNCPICRTWLGTKVKAISDEMMIIMKQELRHVENSNGTIRICNLVSFFQCSLCKYCPTRKPTFQCENGHLICAECREDGSLCLCRLLIYKASSRSLFSQKILELSSKPCRFTHYGCKAVITDLNQHEKEKCQYREVFCIFYNCKMRLSMIYLPSHLEELNPEHDNIKVPLSLNFGQELEGGSGFLHLPSCWDDRSPYRNLDTFNFMKIKNKILVFVCWASSSRKRCMLWVYCLGLVSDANKFGFKLRLYNEGSKKEIHVTGPVVSVDLSHYKVSLIGPECHPLLSFRLTFKEIREYWSQESIQFAWEVEVFEKKSLVLNNVVNFVKIN